MDIELASKLITLGIAIIITVILVAVDYYSPLCCTKGGPIELSSPVVFYINENECLVELIFDIENNKWNKTS